MTDFYTSYEDGLPVKTDIDLDLIDHAPDDDYPWLLWTFLKVRKPLSDGQPDSDEEELLYDIRHELIRFLHDDLNILYAGSRLIDGWFELYFYAPSPKRFENIVTEVMQTHAEYAFESGTRHDHKWEQYIRRLYPNVRQYQQIQSRDTLLALAEEGDDPMRERPVEHYVFFKSRSNEERFTAAAVAAGFSAVEQVEQDDETYPYGIILERVCTATFEVIEEDIDRLFDLAAKEHGHYEGWSTVLAEPAHV